HALGTGRWLAPGQLVEEAQHGPAVGAATDVLLCLPTLARRQRRIPGPTLSRAEQDRHAFVVIHGHIPMTTGRPRLWRGPPGGGDPPAAPAVAPPRDPRRGSRGTPVGPAGGRSRGRGRAPCGRRGSAPRTRDG